MSSYQKELTQQGYTEIPDKSTLIPGTRWLHNRLGLAFAFAVVALAGGFAFFRHDNKPTGTMAGLPSYHQALLDLNETIAGAVVFRSDGENLEQASRAWVRHVGLPYALVLVASEDDIAQSIRMFSAHKIPFRVRSGGHHKLGYSTLADGVVLDLQKLSEIRWKTPEILQVGPATTVSELYDFMRPHKVASVMGFCGSVGEAGFVLGGGWGILSRSYGLGLDNAVGFRIVLANGSAISPDDDLDWALRGAGSGGFGVVSSLTYQVHPISQILQVMSVHITSTVERADFLYKVGELNPPGNMIILHDSIETVNIIWWGQSDNIALRGETFITSLLQEKTELSNATREFYNITWDDMYETSVATDGVDWGKSVYAAACWTGFLMPQNNTKEVWREIMRIFDEHVDHFLLPDIELWGGAISDRSQSATAFPYREAVYNVGVLLLMQEENLELYESKIAAVDQWWPEVAVYLQGTYVNYPMRGSSPTTIWGENLPRLMELKKRYDPENLFDQPLGVPVPLGYGNMRN